MVIYLNTIADLKADTTVPPFGDSLAIIVGGYHLPGDGGGGTFIYYDAAMPWLEDGGLIIKNNNYSPPSNNVWYKRLVHEPYISVKWFGAYGNDMDDDIDAIRRTFQASKVPVYISPTVTNVDLGNYDSWQDSSSHTVRDGARTRIYFPAGIYRISDTIAFANLDPYPASFLEVIGERSVIKPYDALYDPNHWAMDLEAAWHCTINNITFSGFNKGLKLFNNNTDAGAVLINKVHFSDIADVSVSLECTSSYVEFNNCSWRYVTTALHQIGCDRCVINGGWLNILEFTADYQSPFRQEHGSLHIYNMICVEPEENVYSNTASWVKMTGRPTTLLLDNMRFGSENGGLSLVNSWVIGNNWNEGWRYALGINIRNCNCPTIGFGDAVPVRLFEVPNFVVFEDNKGFTGLQPIIWIDPSLDLSLWRGLFSIKLDNIAYAYHKLLFNQYNNLYNTLKVTSPTQKAAQLALLPFVRINNGLTSYGFLEHQTPNDLPLIFFQGFTSFDLTEQYGAISGDYSYEVKLTNVLHYDGSDVGYSFFRIEVGYDPGSNDIYIDKVIDITNNPNNNAPIIFKDSSPNDNLLLVNTRGNEPYEIYYEITCLIPPVSRPFNGIT